MMAFVRVAITAPPNPPHQVCSAGMPPTLPTLDEMRTVLRAGMTRNEFFLALDELAERPGGLRFGSPTADTNIVSIPVAEGSELLCFLTGDALTYVEYNGGIFLEVKS